MFHLPKTAGFLPLVGEPAADLITFAVKSKSHIGRFGKVAFTVVASSGNRGKAGVGVFV